MPPNGWRPAPAGFAGVPAAGKRETAKALNKAQKTRRVPAVRVHAVSGSFMQ